MKDINNNDPKMISKLFEYIIIFSSRVIRRPKTEQSSVSVTVEDVIFGPDFGTN